MLHLVDKYFLILVIIHGLVVRVIDYGRYKRQKQDALSRKARIISSGIMLIAIALFILRKIMD